MPNPDNVTVIAKPPPPKNVLKVHIALAHIGWYCQAIQDYADTTIHLTIVMKKNVPILWDE